MKRRLFALLLAAAVLAALSACGKKPAETPEPSATAAPTATPESGKSTSSPNPTATASTPEAEEVELDGDCFHTQLAPVITMASCTADGKIEYVCQNCGGIVSTEVLPATGHNYRTESSADTHWTVCTVCGEKTAQQAHSIKDGACTVCGYKEGHTHTETSVVTAPTCTENGYTTHTCSGCGQSYTDSITPALGHEYTSRMTKAATCTESGVKTFTCTRCGDSYTETVPAMGHVYANGKCVLCGAADPAGKPGSRDDGVIELPEIEI